MPQWKASSLRLKKKEWSTIIQLKLGHGYFKSYLQRLPEYESNNCHCHTFQSQSPDHLLFNCPNYNEERNNTINNLNRSERTIKNLFQTDNGRQKLIEYLQKTIIATRNWLLNL
jgi:hypothetical protein